MLIKANQANGQDSCKNVEIFKNNATFKILTNMFPRYIHHCQCDGYESLNTAVKRACYNFSDNLNIYAAFCIPTQCQTYKL